MLQRQHTATRASCFESIAAVLPELIQYHLSSSHQSTSPSLLACPEILDAPSATNDRYILSHRSLEQAPPDSRQWSRVLCRSQFVDETDDSVAAFVPYLLTSISLLSVSVQTMIRNLSLDDSTDNVRNPRFNRQHPIQAD
jgi:hypothetical protein